MKVLAFTVGRPWEFIVPLETLDSNVVVISSEPSNSNMRRYLHLIQRGKREFKQFDPDVILVDGLDLLGLLVVLFSAWYQVPLIVRLGGNPWTGRHERIRGLKTKNDHRLTIASLYVRMLFDRIALAFADGFIVVSRSLKDELLQQTDIPSERIAIVHYPPKNKELETTSGVDSKSYAPVPDAETIILTVTNLTYRGKFDGVRRILRDIEEILLRYDNAVYVIAGDGPYHDQLENFIENRITDPDVKDRIYTPGFVSDVNELYVNATIVAYISFIDAYPNAILEAQMAGLPIVANASHGIVEQIEDGETGILINPSDEDDLKDEIEYLIENPKERRRLGKNATQRVKERNDPKKIGKQMLESITYISDEN